jgi:glycosyltransferase involved in cell wall biosynthesis
MACGLPCIATDCPIGGVRSLLTSGENGLLIPVGDEDALFKAMCKLADDEAYAAWLGQRAAGIRNRLDEALVSQNWRRYLEHVSE